MKPFLLVNAPPEDLNLCNPINVTVADFTYSGMRIPYFINWTLEEIVPKTNPQSITKFKNFLKNVTTHNFTIPIKLLDEFSTYTISIYY
jgi:hypothetical protein